MKKRLTLVSLVSIVLCLSCHSAGGAEGYDYFNNARYPATSRSDVSLDRIEQQGGPEAVGYNKRVVHWWPKKGVDSVNVPEGVEARTWTVRTAELEPLVEAGFYAKWWPVDLRGKKKFKAHLIGFRGIGSKEGDPFTDEALVRAQGKGICPSVILRLKDGRKRCFSRGSFSDEDQEYILNLYEKEMARIHETLEPPPEKHREEIKARWPVCKLNAPGTYSEESERFVISSGSEELNDGIPGAWINPRREADAAQYRTNTFRIFEDYWAYNEYSGHLMPFWEKPVRYKYHVVYGSTLANGIEEFGRGNGGGYGGCGTACWEGLYHEWGHGFGSDPMVLLGGGETRCDSLQTMADPTLVRKVSFQIQRPYKNLFWGQYPGGFGYTMLGDDPNWGYGAPASFPCLMSETENTPMHVMARLGQERGIWENGIKGVGDFMGQIGARMAEYDYELEGMLREAYPYPNRACLVAVNRAEGIYRSTREEAPEPFGINVVRLKTEPGAKEITVDFRGLYDPDTYSDWRACIVAVGADGRPRYSPLWNKGEMSMETREGDKRYWLTVTATPYALASGQEDAGGKINHIYQGGFTYKYPYEVKLSGCRPASPHAPIDDNENMELIGPALIARADANMANCGSGDWPHPSDTPEYAEMKQTLERLVKRAPVMLELFMQDGLFTDSSYSPVVGRKNSDLSSRASAIFLEWRATWLLENAQGSRHPNGGGWVAKSATVAPTAYVGPECMVLDGAHVLDNAIIEDYAIVSGPDVLIKDHARVYGKAVVCGNVTLKDYARVSRNIITRSSTIEWDKNNAGSPGYRFQMNSGMLVTRVGPEERVKVFPDAGFMLQANYAFDRPETILLEDWYQEHLLGTFAFGAHNEDLVFYDGILYGKPGFVREGGVSAFTFNGTDQYAEVNGALADLGAITIDVRLKPEIGQKQTVFDFGSSLDNRFMLTIDAGGTPAVVVERDGETETITADTALRPDQWSSCRVEIDGKNIRLWINDKKVCENPSDFRAADVFPAGVEKRNFIAAERGQNNFFKGSIDHLRVYFTVYADFSEAPEPPMVSSRRIDPEFLQRFNQRYADYEMQESRYKDTLQKTDIYRFYDEWKKTVDKHIEELSTSAEVRKMEEKLAGMQADYETRRGERYTAFEQRAENIEKRKRWDEIEKKRSDRFQQLRGENAGIMALQAEEDEARTLRERIEREARETIKDELTALQEKRQALDKRRNEYQQRSKKNEAEWQDLEQQMHQINMAERDLIIGAAGRDPRYSEAQQKEEQFRRKKDQLQNQLWQDSALLAWDAEKQTYGTHNQREAYVTTNTLPLLLEINKTKIRVKDLRTETGTSRSPDEYLALTSVAAKNGEYGWVLEQEMKSKLLPLMPESRQQLREAAPLQQAPWHTRVDWDGRTRWEQSGEELQPIMKRWFTRMRAPRVSADHRGEQQ